MQTNPLVQLISLGGYQVGIGHEKVTFNAGVIPNAGSATVAWVQDSRVFVGSRSIQVSSMSSPSSLVARLTLLDIVIGDPVRDIWGTVSAHKSELVSMWINWGDGSGIETVSTPIPTTIDHTYSSPGSKTVRVGVIYNDTPGSVLSTTPIPPEIGVPSDTINVTV